MKTPLTSEAAADVPWASIAAFPERPPDAEYGYLSGRELQSCTREQLIEACSKDRFPPVHLVFTPENDRLQPPGEVPFLFDAVKRRARTRFRTSLAFGLFALLPFGGLFLHTLGRKEAPLFLIYAVFLGLLPVAQSAQGLWSLVRSRRRPSPGSS